MKKLFILLVFFPGIVYCDSLSVLFLGDTHFGENYQTDTAYNNGVNVIEEYGHDYFFENVKDILNSSDITFCNLETPLTNKIDPVSRIKPYLHWSDPLNTIKYFQKYNISNVTLGNNHVFDQEVNGFNETVNSLNKSGIKYFGAGVNSDEASKPLIFSQRGFTVMVFGGFEYRQKYDTLYDFYAGNEKAGVNLLDTVNFTERIKQYKMANPSAIIVIYPHWGSNYKQASEMQKAMAHNWMDAGADIIIGQGAHTVQEIELYNGKWIIYNIGNFIFNAPGRYTSTGAKPYGMMVKLIIKNSGLDVELYPVFTNNNMSNYQIRPLDEDELIDCAGFISKQKKISKIIDGKFIKLLN